MGFWKWYFSYIRKSVRFLASNPDMFAFWAILLLGLVLAFLGQWIALAIVIVDLAVGLPFLYYKREVKKS